MDKLELNFEDGEHFPVLHMKGGLSLYNSNRLKEKFISIREQGTKHFVVNMKELEAIDSSGLGVLINQLKTFLDEGGEYVLCNLNESIQSLFSITRYDAFFKIYDSISNAQKYLKGI
jgi:anti-sigma B factor antagonist